MDPLTQALLGATAVQAIFSRSLGRQAVLIGLVGGELADADVLLGPLADPALPHELHRHFTHALAFIPVGGLLAALPFLLVKANRTRAGLVIAAATLAYATHGLLDNTTSYGTHLLWPFVAHRTAWDVMSIIDPLFTGVLLAGVVAGLWRGTARGPRIAGTLALLYLVFGCAQHARAAAVQAELAARRGHEPVRARVMPTLGNVIVWRSIYEANGELHADAVRLPVGGGAQVRVGTSRPRFTAADLPAGGADPERVREVFAGLSAFATGFTTAESTGGGTFVADARYSMAPGGFRPMWGIMIDDARVPPVRWSGPPGDPRDARALLIQLWAMIRGDAPGFERVTME